MKNTASFAVQESRSHLKAKTKQRIMSIPQHLKSPKDTMKIRLHSILSAILQMEREYLGLNTLMTEF